MPEVLERPFAGYRRTAGLCPAQAAARLGITPRYLRQLETSQAPLSLRLAERMSTEYGVPLQALMTPNRADGTGGRGEKRKPRPGRIPDDPAGERVGHPT